MVNETNLTAQPEDWRIDVSDSWQVLWWCRYLDITKSQLEFAVNTVGNNIGDIQQFLASTDKLQAPRPSVAGVAVAAGSMVDLRFRDPF